MLAATPQPASEGAEFTRELLLLRGTEDLIAWADQLCQQKELWEQQRTALRDDAYRQKVAWWQFNEAQRALYEPFSASLRSGHAARLDELQKAAEDARRKLLREQFSLQRCADELREEALFRKRLFRARLQRERDLFKVEEERQAREARERETCERLRLERHQARNEHFRAEVQRDLVFLTEELAAERAARTHPSANLAVQTDRPPLQLSSAVQTIGAPFRGNNDDGVADDDSGYSEDSFEDDFEDESTSRSGSASGRSKHSASPSSGDSRSSLRSASLPSRSSREASRSSHGSASSSPRSTSQNGPSASRAGPSVTQRGAAARAVASAPRRAASHDSEDLTSIASSVRESGESLPRGGRTVLLASARAAIPAAAMSHSSSISDEVYESAESRGGHRAMARRAGIPAAAISEGGSISEEVPMSSMNLEESLHSVESD